MSIDDENMVKLLKAEIESYLTESKPILDSVNVALSKLNKASIDELKKFRSPPRKVKEVLEAVCVLKGVAPDIYGDYWLSAKRMMSEFGFIQSLISFDCENVRPEYMKFIRERYLTDLRFNPETIAKISKPCSDLCSWVLAVEKSYRVHEVIREKRAKLAIAEENALHNDTVINKIALANDPGRPDFFE